MFPRQNIQMIHEDMVHRYYSNLNVIEKTDVSVQAPAEVIKNTVN